METLETKTQYRGKYPRRIKAVYSIKGERGIIGVTLNNGEKHTISAKATAGRMPQPGEDMADYEAQKKRNTCFYVAGDKPGTADVYLRGASGRWCCVVNLPAGEYDAAFLMTDEQARAHFEANKYPGDWLEM